ncbi:endonuclease domain-containing protein [Mycolicibacterium palauense]|uniref:endonuclease domain-containing protein n=1 Tax=Mycolicibacterium palauense TaxID=2034511 RepID=UPI000BFF18E1|nr:hypothetical protein [Mycolicibacterium palauense]
MRNLIVGSQALATGALTEHQLRVGYRRLHRDVYVPKGTAVTRVDHIDGAWMRSGRRGVVAGLAAAALHGSHWIDDRIDVELIWNNTRPPAGIIARDERIGADEITRRSCISVTTAARTAFDLGRHLPRGEALARLDALVRATAFRPDEVTMLMERYRGARGLRRLREVLPLVDRGAESPQETRLRLLFIDAGLPRPRTQVPALDGRGRVVRTLDMGWEEYRVAAEYDGEQHQTNRAQYLKDRRVLPVLASLGWTVIRVVKEDRDEHTVEQVVRALTARGWGGVGVPSPRL